MSDLGQMMERLRQVLEDCAPAALAVSGGVDSMTLAFVAHRHLPGQIAVYHAVSPAVPKEATARLSRYADQEAWKLAVLNAGEFDDPDYISNPANRCFFCKTHLYGRIREATTDQILSGTNLDDLGDWRPGLNAATDHGVRHPYVEAGIDKKTLRLIAAWLGLRDLEDLPSAPCLSSRIETGLAIDGEILLRVNAVENLLRRQLSARTARCRIRKHALVIELDDDSLSRLDARMRSRLAASIDGIFAGFDLGTPLFEAYRRGSAFLR